MNTVMIYYSNVNFFPECNKIINGYSSKWIEDDNCGEQFFNRVGIEKDSFLEKNCGIALLYLSDIDLSISSHKIPREAGYTYLYYWVYHVVFKSNYSEDMKKFYKALIDDHYRTYKSIISKYIAEDISKVNLEKLKILYDVYACLYDIKENNGYQNDSIFCSSLKYITEIYNKEMNHQLHNISNPHTLNSHKSNMGIYIVIPILVILLISLFTLTLYKYNIHGSHLLEIIKRKISTYSNINEKGNKIGDSEMFIGIQGDSRYNVLYNYE
ncbi:variable surface protein [Plasmodium gonderi]|uniref:Variable surface protein n=1 Tax=Plasmodium gonderi TaxID=77519 RepID=A0A1Y1JPA8_PLAGO|nr:variable surface protein [Plasmodium gonderi]GAW84426.1 variable surface protein [Plasmodium gonderi]